MSGQRKRPLALRQASAYYRLARKAERAGNWRQAEQYRRTADRKVDENRRNAARKAEREAQPASPFKRSIR